MLAAWSLEISRIEPSFLTLFYLHGWENDWISLPTRGMLGVCWKRAETGCTPVLSSPFRSVCVESGPVNWRVLGLLARSALPSHGRAMALCSEFNLGKRNSNLNFLRGRLWSPGESPVLHYGLEYRSQYRPARYPNHIDIIPLWKFCKQRNLPEAEGQTSGMASSLSA